MAKITKVVGTGITRRGIVEFDWDVPGDVDLQIQAAIETFNRSSFERLSRQLKEFAGRILADAELPHDPESTYAVTEDGAWIVVNGAARPEGLPLPSLVQLCGYQADSPQGYAAELLMILSAAKAHLRSGTVDDAMALAFAAGELVKEAGIKEMWEADAVAGEKVREGGRAAHERTYGTEEEKAAKRADYLREFDAALARGLSRMDAYKEAARRCGVSVRTIERAVAARNRDT